MKAKTIFKLFVYFDPIWGVYSFGAIFYTPNGQKKSWSEIDHLLD